VVASSSQHYAPPSALTDALSLHLRFRLDAEPSYPLQETHKKAKTELKAIQDTLPAVHSPTILASMTAYFFILCHVDDLVEEMSPDAAQAILMEVPGLFQGPRRQSLALGMLGEPDSQPSVFRNRSKSCYTCDYTFAQQIRHVIDSFRRHVTELLHASTYESLCCDICKVFAAMSEEIHFRRQMDCDMRKYLSIRVLTIGLTPLFNLLRVSMGHSGQPSQNLDLLDQGVHLIVGLQNDIVGVQKDVVTREWMNYAVVYAKYHGDIKSGERLELVEEGMQKAVDSHNVAMELVMEYWEAIVEGGDAKEIQVALSLLVFVAEHFKWATRSKRYKS
jgi:hypothetical protein